MRCLKHILVCTLAPLAAGSAQLSGGVGPVGLAASSSSTWQASARLTGSARFESPWTATMLEGSFLQSFRLTDITARQDVFSPAYGALRGVTSVRVEKESSIEPAAGTRLTTTSSVAYRRGAAGAWLGVEAGTARQAALRLGSWRQVGERLTLSVSSSLRRGVRAPRFWTETVRDSIPTDTGYVWGFVERIRGDSGGRMSWLESEARLGWTYRRLALDGVVGWRPPVDSTTSAAWFRGFATLAVTPTVALTAGAGTRTRQVPFVRNTGRYATVAVRFAPAALLRPRETPEVTPVAASFRVEPAGDHYIVRVRLPRARVVELSGDFNGWTPIRLERQLDDSWLVALPLRPGAYRMNLRVDGERWLPPPGTAAVDDEFNGQVGLVVVR